MKNVRPKHKDTGGPQWRGWQRFSPSTFFICSVWLKTGSTHQSSLTAQVSQLCATGESWLKEDFLKLRLIIVSILLLTLRMTAHQCLLQAAGPRSKPQLTLTVFVNTAALSSAIGQRAARPPGSTGIKPVKPLNYFQIQLENRYLKHRSTWNTPAGTEEDVQTWTAVPQLAGGQRH